MKQIWIIFCYVALFFWEANVYAYNPDEIVIKEGEVPRYLKGVGVTEQLGKKIDLSLTFKDENGVSRPLKEFFQDGKPVILSLVYFRCPSLCGHHLNGLLDALRKMKWKVGKDFKVLSVSLNPLEDSILALSKKQNYMEGFKDILLKKDAENFWFFLTGNEQNIRKLAQQMGVQYKWSKDDKQYLHPSVLLFLNSSGKISRYLHGLVFEPRNMNLGVQEAAAGKIGSFLDQIIFYCSRFDPKKGKYTLYAWRIMQAGGALTVLLLAMFLIPVWIDRRGSR